MPKRSYAKPSLLLGTTNFSPINPLETTTGFIVAKKIPYNFLQTVGHASWNGLRGHKINREIP